MKYIFLAITSLLSFTSIANSNFIQCTSFVDYHDGMSGETVFQFVKGNTSISEWEYGEFLTLIIYDNETPQFNLKLIKNNLFLIDQEIIIGTPIAFHNNEIDYTLLCLSSKKKH